MSERYRVVAPDRFLSTQFVEGTVGIRHSGYSLLATDSAVQLHEAARPVVSYVPVDDLSGATLVASNTRFRCRWKGDATYYDVHLNDGSFIADGAWGYPTAPEEIALLRNRVSFDTARFTEYFQEHA